EDALRESEERFRRVFEGAPIGLLLFDQTGRLIQANTSLAAMVGYDVEEFGTLDLADLTHPEDREALAEIKEQLFQKPGLSHVIEKRFLAKNRDFVWVRLTTTTIRSSGGAVSALAMVENITDRRRSDAEKAALLAAEQTARIKPRLRIGPKNRFWPISLMSCELRCMPSWAGPECYGLRSWMPRPQLRRSKQLNGTPRPKRN